MNLENKTIEELKQILKNMGISSDSYNKEYIIQLIEENLHKQQKPKIRRRNR